MPLEPRMDGSLAQRLQRQLERWQCFAPCPGANVSIFDARLGHWHGAAGYADVDSMRAMPTEAASYIYSISKTFTAVRVLQLYEQGRLALDQPITHYLPDLGLPAAVSVRRLLNHTSGVASYTDWADYLPANRAQPGRPWSYDDVLTRLRARPLDFTPGAAWHYSNTGYMLLHRLIETLSGQSFADDIAQAIIQPLGLTRTYVATAVDRGRLTPGYCHYLNDLQVMEDVMPVYHPGWCLTGLIVATTDEVARLYRALFDGELLGAEALAQMTAWVACQAGAEPHPFFIKPAYGLGLMIDPEWPHGGLYSHGGDGPGCNTWAMYLPDFHGRPLALAIFCNASINAHPWRLSKALLRVLEQGT